MQTEDMIRELENTAKKYEDKFAGILHYQRNN